MTEDFEDLLRRAAQQLGLPEAGEGKPPPAPRPQRPKVMIVEDDAAMRRALGDVLGDRYHPVVCASGQEALDAFSEDIEAVVLDIKMAGMDGLAVMEALKDRAPDVPVIFNTGYPGEYREEAIEEAYEPFGYVTKGEPRVLLAQVKSAVRHHELTQRHKGLNRHLEALLFERTQENTRLRQEVEGRYQFDQIIGQSPAMQRVFDLLAKVIEGSTTVLLEGETGTGKELVARAIHYNSPRRDYRFVVQNCGAMPESLLASELFGHKRGAFTGAIGDKKGLFELAHRGTIFLDEIAETSPAMQVSLLRALQHGEIRPLGEAAPRQVDVRVVAATHRDLTAEVKSGRFREDLYYRLNVFPIPLPPLRHRQEDIPLLAHHFFKGFCERLGKNLPGLHPDTLACLGQYPFPGNVRELENEMERAVTLASEGQAITPDLLSERIRRGASRDTLPKETASGTLKQAVERLERKMLEAALKVHNGNRTRAAAALGLSRLGLLKKIRRYRLER